MEAKKIYSFPKLYVVAKMVILFFQAIFSPPHINLTKKNRLSTKENTADEKTLKSISNTKTDTQTNKT